MNGNSLHGERSDAATIVFLHGQPGDSSDWSAVTAALPAGYRALSLDRPGYGSSGLPAGTVASNVQWLLTELDRAQAERVILVGHSYGGAVAIATAAAAPDRVSGLILVASVGPHCLTFWDPIFAAPAIGPLLSATGMAVTPWLARNYQRLRAGGNSVLPDHPMVDFWARQTRPGDPLWPSVLTEQRELIAVLSDLNDALARVEAPAVILADPLDKVVPVPTAYALRDGLRNGELRLVEGAGHHIPLLRPDAVVESITRLGIAVA